MREEPERLGGAVRGDDLVVLAAVERGDRARRRAVVGVARDVGVEGTLERVAQPTGRPTRDDVDGMVGVARSDVAVAVVAKEVVAAAGALRLYRPVAPHPQRAARHHDLRQLA